MCTAYLDFERQREAARRAGPTAQQIANASERLKADDETLYDALGFLDRDQIKPYLGAAVRGNDADAIAYVKELRRQIDAVMKPWAIATATEELNRSWDDAAEAISSRLDAEFDRMFGVVS